MVAIRYYPCPVDYQLLTTDIFTTIGERRSAKPNFLWVTNMSQDLQIKEHRDSNVDKYDHNIYPEQFLRTCTYYTRYRELFEMSLVL